MKGYLVDQRITIIITARKIRMKYWFGPDLNINAHTNEASSREYLLTKLLFSVSLLFHEGVPHKIQVKKCLKVSSSKTHSYDEELDISELLRITSDWL